MSRTLGKVILLLAIAVGLVSRAQASSTATITLNGAEQQGDANTITVSFNGYVETVHYGQYSTIASIASALGGMFTRDYAQAGLSAQVLCGGSTSTVTFKLQGTATFGALDVTGSTTSFQLTSSGFSSQGSSISDTGTVTLSVGGMVAASTNYGAGATPSSVASGLAAGVTSGSLVNVTATGDGVYLQAKTTGSGTNYGYTVETTSYDSADFGQPSFVYPAVTGNLDGGGDAGSGSPQTVYSYAAGYDGAGNVTSYNDLVTGSWTFGYDGLNRLSSGTPGAGAPGGYAGMHLCFNYDAFGNRTQADLQPAACNPGSDPTNASYNAANQVNGLSHDAAGNVLNDGRNQYLYDPEGRICAVSTSYNGTTIMTGYLYDAGGARVAKGSIQTWGSCDPAVNGFHTMTAYVLGPGGEQVTEASVDANNNLTWVHTNVWEGGAVLATYDNNGLHFYLNDPLGTRRVQTNYAGVTEQSCQSLPYGDGETCSPSEHLFTGKERDSESGNDYFGARYYASSMGRFLSPDFGGPMPNMPDAVPWADFENPQSLNLYSYVGNNPLTGTDDDGHDYYLMGGSQCGQNGINCDQQGYVLGADGNRSVVTDQALANGTYGANFDSNGNLTSITTGQGTFGAQFFDASPNTPSAIVPADEPISGWSQSFIQQTNAYNQGAKPMMDVLALNAAAGMGITALSELTLEGGMTTLGNITATPTSGEVASAQNTLATGGRKGVERAIRALAKRIAEHQEKLKTIKGNPGSIERELATWRRQIIALQQVLR